MWMIRHLFAVVVLPFTVTILVPYWIAERYAIRVEAGDNPIELASQLIGMLCVGIGLLLFAASLRRFATDGRGTLAPWDPPRRLVVTGPYRYVRNPMISGVVFILLGEALALLSSAHLMWAMTFLALNVLYIPLIEEPQLRTRFGEAYREYSRHVPQLVPRLRPWKSQGESDIRR